MKELTLQDFIQGIGSDQDETLYYLGFGIERLNEAPLDQIKKGLSENIVQKCMVFTELFDQSTKITFDDNKVIVGVTSSNGQKNYQIVLIINNQFQGLIKINTIPFRSRTNYVCEPHFCNEESFEFLHDFFKEFKYTAPAIAA